MPSVLFITPATRGVTTGTEAPMYSGTEVLLGAQTLPEPSTVMLFIVLEVENVVSKEPVLPN